MALTQHYVDPAINANSGTGTIGDPYGDLQYALNTATRDATNGNQFNIKAGTSEALAAALSLTTYGTPTADAPLVFRGYTSAAGDGGIGVISGGGSYAVIASTSYVHFIDLRLTNSGANSVLTFNIGCLAFRCEIDTNTGTNNLVSALAGADNSIIGCYLHDSTYPCISIGTSGKALYNYCKMTTASEAISGNGTGCVIHGNVILLTTGTTVRGISVPYGWAVISNNSIYCSTASTQYGISVSNASGRPGQLVFNNIIAGFSGAGGIGIKGATQHLGLAGGNAFYNCTANYNLADGVIVDLSALDVALGANPFTDAPNGDFSLTTAGKAALRGLGWPSAFKGAHANTDAHNTIGAIQYGESEACSYPSANDVRYGVTYDIYTGNMTLPVVGDVKATVQYGTNGTQYTGTYAPGGCDYPAVSDVRLGTSYDTGSSVGTLNLPAVADVQSGVSFDNGTKTGTFVAPSVGDVEAGVTYGAASEYTGTFAVPTVGQVESGVGYGAGGTEFTGTLAGGSDWTTDEKKQIRKALGVTGTTAATTGTGTLEAAFAALATEADISDAIWDEVLSGHSTDGTAGKALSTVSSGGVDPSVLADAVWDELAAGHTDSGKAGARLWTDIPAILADTGTDGVVVASIAANAVNASALATDAVSEITAAILALSYEGSETLQTFMRVVRAFVAGTVTGGNTASPRFKSADGGTDRIIMAVDNDGNRSAVTVNGA